MAQLDPNQYKAVWKHKTPLNSDYLNILLEGQEPGLVSLPTITSGESGVTVGPFSAFVQPVDENENYLPNEIIKVVVTQDTLVTVVRDTDGTAKTRGIGLKVVKTGTETRILIDAVDAAGCAGYKGIFIASVLYPQGTSDCWATTNGADFSDLLLTKLGYDPSFWVSPVSPRRNVGYKANVNDLISLWEIRFHNDIYDNILPNDHNWSFDTFPILPMINQGGYTLPAVGFSSSEVASNHSCWDLSSTSLIDIEYLYVYLKRTTYTNDNPIALGLGGGHLIHSGAYQHEDYSTSVYPSNSIPMVYLTTANTTNIYESGIKPMKTFYGLYINVSSDTLQIN